MPLYVPDSLTGVLSLCRGAFTQPTYLTFVALTVGRLSVVGERTVTGMLVGARLSGVWHHARAHRFFSTARWSVDDLGFLLADAIVSALCPTGAITVAIDDTLMKRSGRKVFGAFWHYDATSPDPSGGVAWGNNFVVAGLVVTLPFTARPVCLPVLFRLSTAKDQGPSKLALAREMTELLAARFPTRLLDVVGDGAYGGKPWRGVACRRVSLTFRLRVDAALSEHAPPRTGKRGRPATQGKRLRSLTKIALDPATCWQNSYSHRYGKGRTLHVLDLHCLWYEAFAGLPVRVILIQDTSKACGFELALITTDLIATPGQIASRYAWRWAIEVAFQEGKGLFGAGQARNRTQRAVQRTAPFGFLTMTMTILWYTGHGHHPDTVTEHRTRAPWYRSKTDPSTADMLAKLRRTIIAAQYHPGQAQTPTHAQITQVQHAWAAAGL